MGIFEEERPDRMLPQEVDAYLSAHVALPTFRAESWTAAQALTVEDNESLTLMEFRPSWQDSNPRYYSVMRGLRFCGVVRRTLGLPIWQIREGLELTEAEEGDRLAVAYNYRSAEPFHTKPLIAVNLGLRHVIEGWDSRQQTVAFDLLQQTLDQTPRS